MSNVPEETFLEEPPLAGWRTLIRSFSTLAVGETFARAAGFVTIIVMARELGPYAFGLVVLGTALATWFGLVADSGTELLTMRNVSRDPGRFRSIADHVLGLRLALSVVAVILCVATILLVVGTSTYRREVLLPFALMIPAIALNLRWIVLGVDGSRYVAAANISSQLLLLLGVLLLVSGEHAAPVVGVIAAAAQLLYAVVILGAVARRFGLVLPRVDLQLWRKTLTDSLPLMASQIARGVIFSFNLFLIAVILGAAKTGFYAAGLKPVLFVMGVTGMLSTTFLASFSAARSDQRRHELASRTVRLGALASLPVAALMTIAAPVVVPLFYGDNYDPAIAPFAIAAWAVPFLVLGVPYATSLIASDRQRTLLKHNLVGAGFLIAGSLVATPLLGIEGAAVVMVASFALVVALNHRTSVALGLVPPLVPTLRSRAPVGDGVLQASRSDG
jgi:O-antigen/teichoic acid export membrane protein